ncbi:MAG: hypothetical protein AABW73_01905 [Nanoarchaeota archaeon]
MDSYECEVSKARFRVYHGHDSFDHFRSEIYKDGLRMVDFSGLVEVLALCEESHSSGASALLSMTHHRFLSNTGVLWTPDKVYVWDSPETDADGKLSICQNTCDFFLSGCHPDANGITWNENLGKVRSLSYSFPVSFDKKSSDFESNALVNAVAKPSGVRLLSDFYCQDGPYYLTAMFKGEVGPNGRVSPSYLKIPSGDEALFISCDSSSSSSDRSVAIALLNNVVSSRYKSASVGLRSRSHAHSH